MLAMPRSRCSAWTKRAIAVTSSPVRASCSSSAISHWRAASRKLIPDFIGQAQQLPCRAAGQGPIVTLGAMLVLGIESSCDETGVALVDAGGPGTPRLLAHALHSQVRMHEAYGGVVPELASRDHIRRVLPLTREVLAEAGRELA